MSITRAPFQKPRKSTPWDLTFSPRSLREPAKSSKRASWLPRPLPSSTRPSERTGVMTAPQARWLVPHRPRKSKEVGPRGGPRFRTTSILSRLAGIPPAGPSSMAAWPNRRQQAGPQGRSRTFLVHFDREKAATERGRKESIGLMEDRAEDGCSNEENFWPPRPPPHQRLDRRGKRAGDRGQYS